MDNNQTIEPTHFASLYPDTSRFAEIEKIVTFIKEGNSCQVVSLPGVGRSNLLGLLSYNRTVRIKHFGENQTWFHFVTINFSEVRKKPLFDTVKLLFLTLVESLRERKMDTEFKYASTVFKESLGFNDELLLFQGLKKTIDLCCIEKQLTIVFLFDRFEEYIPTLTNEFFANLRLLRDRAKYRFSVVFSLNRPLEDSIEPSLFADFYEFLAGHTIFLSLFDKPGLDFRIAYLEKATGKTLDKTLLEKILFLTAAHGKLTKLSVEAVLTATLPETTDLTTFLFSQKFIQGALKEIWLSFSPSEQQYLTKLPKKEQNQYLQDIGIIKENKVTIPLFEMYIKQLAATNKTNASITRLSFDSDNNNILKGGIMLTEKLTALEFKLLKYLLQNPDKLLDREELITAVWSDAQSTAGVTDQAIDQLIFRLRRKIEDDPNNPTHLQTVKGRGIKFIP